MIKIDPTTAGLTSIADLMLKYLSSAGEVNSWR